MTPAELEEWILQQQELGRGNNASINDIFQNAVYSQGIFTSGPLRGGGNSRLRETLQYRNNAYWANVLRDQYKQAVNTTPTNTGNQTGSINQDIINDAINNLPSGVDLGDVQSGPNTPNVNGPDIPQGTDTADDQSDVIGDGQVPDAPNNGGSIFTPPIFGGPIWGPGGEPVFTGPIFNPWPQGQPQSPTQPTVIQGPQQQPQQQQQAPGLPTNRPNETGIGLPTVGDVIGDGPIVGDGSGQIPTGDGNVITGGDNEDTGGGDDGGFLDILLGALGGVFGQQPNGNQNLSNIIADLIGDISNTNTTGDSTATVGDTSATGGSIGDTSAQGGNAQGGNSSNSLSDLLSNVGNTVLNMGASNYVADKQLEGNRDALALSQGIFDKNVERLEPFRQAGLEAFPALQAEANSNPQLRDLFNGVGQAQAGNRAINNLDSSLSYDAPSVTSTSGLPEIQAGDRALSTLDPSINYNAPNVTSTSNLPALQAGNRDTSIDSQLNYQGPQAGNRAVNLGDSSAVKVNQINPLDRNDPYLRFLQDEQRDAIEGSAVARGGLFSGDTLEALQDRAANVASNYMGQIQGISSAQDQSRLASQGQSFGQTTTNANVNNQLNQQDFGNSLSAANFNVGAQGQQFGQDFSAAQFNNNQNQQDLQNSSGIRGQLFNEGNTQFGQGLNLANLDIGTQGQEFSQGLQGNSFNNLLNQQDFSNSAAARGQMFGEGNTQFGQGLNLAGLDVNTQGQEFAQGMQGNSFNNLLNQQDFANSGILGDTNFNRNLQANNFATSQDQNSFGQLYELARLGQNSAANQGAGAASFANIGADILQNNGDIKTARTSGYTNALAGLF